MPSFFHLRVWCHCWWVSTVRGEWEWAQIGRGAGGGKGEISVGGGSFKKKKKKIKVRRKNKEKGSRVKTETLNFCFGGMLINEETNIMAFVFSCVCFVYSLSIVVSCVWVV